MGDNIKKTIDCVHTREISPCSSSPNSSAGLFLLLFLRSSDIESEDGAPNRAEQGKSLGLVKH